MNKYTNGPWETAVNSSNEWDVCLPDGGDMVADLAKCDNQEANARLIASAPDLLEACKELLTYIEADNELKVYMYPQSIDYARQTIAKAEGASDDT